MNTAMIIAGMSAGAAIVAYGPPAGCVPQMVSIRSRASTSRAMLAATLGGVARHAREEGMGREEGGTYCLRVRNRRWLKRCSRRLGLASESVKGRKEDVLAMPTIQGAAAGGVKKFVGSSVAQITTL